MKRYIPLLILLITGCTNTPINNISESISPSPFINYVEPIPDGICSCDGPGYGTSTPPQIKFTLTIVDEYYNYVPDAEVKVRITDPSDRLSPEEEKVIYNGNNNYYNSPGYTFTKILEDEDKADEYKYKLDITATKDNWKMSKTLTSNFRGLYGNITFFKFNNKIAYSSLNKVTNLSEINIISSENVGTKTMSENGINLIKISEDGVNSIKPIWSPDGTKIAYIGQINGENTLFTVNSDGTDRKRVYSDIKDSQVSWSSDSKKLLFESNNKNKKNQILLINSDGTNLTELTRLSENNHNPQFSNDGKKIVFVEETDNNSNIILMDSDGSNRTVISSKKGYNNFQFPQWSPDDKKVMYLDSTNRIIVINSDGTNEVIIADKSSGLPKWSPNSKKIVFTSELVSNNGKMSNVVYTINSDGTVKYYLIDNKSINSFPSFSQDGKLIKVISNIDGTNKVYLTSSESYTTALQTSMYKSENADYVDFWTKK